MDIKEMMAAAAARNKARREAVEAALKVAPAAPAKPRLRVYAGQLVTEAMIKAALGIKTLVSWAQSRRSEHKVGATCPHCQGSGRYRLHTRPGSNDKCYRCDGKGRLNEKDMAYLTRRLEGAGPVCWVVSAPAA